MSLLNTTHIIDPERKAFVTGAEYNKYVQQHGAWKWNQRLPFFKRTKLFPFLKTLLRSEFVAVVILNRFDMAIEVYHLLYTRGKTETEMREELSQFADFGGEPVFRTEEQMYRYLTKFMRFVVPLFQHPLAQLPLDTLAQPDTLIQHGGGPFLDRLRARFGDRIEGLMERLEDWSEWILYPIYKIEQRIPALTSVFDLISLSVPKVDIILEEVVPIITAPLLAIGVGEVGDVVVEVLGELIDLWSVWFNFARKQYAFAFGSMLGLIPVIGPLLNEIALDTAKAEQIFGQVVGIEPQLSDIIPAIHGFLDIIDKKLQQIEATAQTHLALRQTPAHTQPSMPPLQR